MDELNDQEVNPDLAEDDEFEMSHTDKLVGIFTEPSSTFERIAKFPPKFIDWFLPLLAVIIFSIIAFAVVSSNPIIKMTLVEKQMEGMEKRLDEMVKQGQLTEEQKEEQLEKTRDFMVNSSSMTLIFTSVTISITMFIMFFIIAGFFLLIVKFGLKGEGGYNSAMVAYGLTHYILIVQIIVSVILSLAFNKLAMGTSIATFMDINTKEFGGYLLTKIDPILIWFYVVFGIGLAKMFKSNDPKKYIITVLATWIGFSILFYFLAQEISLLQGFIQ